ncbi:MAG TPA: NrsF family protein [Polyangiaceae bacterium]|nr:NrsF family protein [Polyangiaceae bacterium]
MTHDPNLARLDEIPDPFAGAAMAPIRPPDGRSLPSSAPRSSVHATRAAVLIAALLFEVAWLAFVERRPDLTFASAARLAVRCAGPLAAAAVALAYATRAGPRGLGVPVERLAIALAAVPAAFAAHTLVFARVDGVDHAFWRHVVACATAASVLAAAPLAAGAWGLRHAFATAPAWRGAALGMACGALAAATMSLACATESAAHVMLGHGVVIVAGAVAGAFVGRAGARA